MIKVCNDCGHGGSDSGAVGVDIIEKDYTLKLGNKIKKLLSNYNIDIVMTRTKDTSISLKQRCEISNSNKCDLFISLHCNAHTNTNANGFESFTYNKNTKLQNILHKNMESIGLKDRGQKTNNFYVLKYTSCEALLIECGFITNKVDSEILNNKIDEISAIITRSIVQYKGLKLIDNRDIYRVVVGSYINRDNAQNMVNQLEKDGYKPFITKATI